MKMEIGLIDDNFFTCGPSWGTGSTGIAPKHIEWCRGIKDITVFTDKCLKRAKDIDCKHKIAWLLEPRSISPNTYEYIADNFSNFRYVLTHDREAITIDKRFIFIPHSGCWIKERDRKIWAKTKTVSMFVSEKQETEGHKLRHAVRKIFKDDIDVFGRSINPVDYKLDGLKDYRYHIVIENARIKTYYTEKLIDAITTGCIPIYWGTPDISDTFQSDGIITFSTIDELKEILKSPCIYDNIDTQYALRNNLFIANNYAIPEDAAFQKVFAKINQ